VLRPGAVHCSAIGLVATRLPGLAAEAFVPPAVAPAFVAARPRLTFAPALATPVLIALAAAAGSEALLLAFAAALRVVRQVAPSAPFVIPRSFRVAAAVARASIP